MFFPPFRLSQPLFLVCGFSVILRAFLRLLWSGVTEKPQPKAGRHFFAAFFAKMPQVFFAFAAFDRTTPKMNNGHAGSAVAAVLATLRSPLQMKVPAANVLPMVTVGEICEGRKQKNTRNRLVVTPTRKCPPVNNGKPLK